MDDTTQSRASDVAASAATRKRRSSILKSQRPARTPFSELEFNVATPTDTAKSRRVSFSRRTGVAEFVTNEATTTWKTFYEEHNKSLESSSNDSDAHASRQSVGHLGKRIFDQQFQVVDAADLIEGLHPVTSNDSRNVDFTDQLTALECSSESKLTAPINKFDLSEFTDQQSKLFGNDFTVPTLGEMSGIIGVNFSTIQPVSGFKNDLNDDLDEIQKDLERSSVVCVGPFSNRPSMSEYIEVDLNTTTVALRNDESDMSITDTVHSPKVQDVSKSLSIDKKVSLNEDWVADKENIAVNPYAAPKESLNFAVNDDPDEVLVFDGKRLTLQSEKSKENNSYRQTILPDTNAETPQRKTIVLNTDDDLPNFAEDMISSKTDLVASSNNSLAVNVSKVNSGTNIVDDNIAITRSHSTNTIYEGNNIDKSKTLVFDEDAGDISVTKSLSSKIITSKTSAERRTTIVYDSDDCNISMTQVLPPNILVTESVEKEKTILYDDKCDISMTQAIPSNIIMPEKPSDKRRTIIFDSEQGDISVTQVLPTNIASSEKVVVSGKRQTILFDDSNISVTQAISPNIIMNDKVQEKRKTIVFDTDTGNISVTQAIPSNIIVPEKRKTILLNENQGDISVTQALPLNVIQPETLEKRRTIIFDEDQCNISVTQAIPNLVLPNKVPEQQIAVVISDNKCNISVTRTVISDIYKTEKRNTIVFDEGDLSITQGISNIMPEKRRTIVFEDNQCDISVTQAIPSNIIQDMGGEDKVMDEVDDISMTQALPVNIVKNEPQEEKVPSDTIETKDPNSIILIKESNINKDSYDSVKISTTQSLPTNVKFNKTDTVYNVSLHDKQSFTRENKMTMTTDPKSLEIEANTQITITPTKKESILNDTNTSAIDNKTVNIINEVKQEVNNTIKPNPINMFLLDNLDCNPDQRVIETNDEEILRREKPLATIDIHDFEVPKVQKKEVENSNLLQKAIEIPIDTLPHIPDKRNTKPIPTDLMAIQAHLMDKSLKQEERYINLDTLVYQAQTKTDIPNIDMTKTEETDSDEKSQQSTTISQQSVPISLQSANTSQRSGTVGEIVLLSPKIENNNIEKAFASEQGINSDIPTRMNSEFSTFSLQTGGCQTSLQYDENSIVSYEVPTQPHQNSLVKSLLDMSADPISVEEKNKPKLKDKSSNSSNVTFEDKMVMTSNTSSIKPIGASNESMFYITRGSDENDDEDDNKLKNDFTQKKEQNLIMKEQKRIEKESKPKDKKPGILSFLPKLRNLTHAPPSLEYKQEEAETVKNIENNLKEIEAIVTQDKSPANRHYEKIVSSNKSDKHKDKSYRNANDTNELLDMISDFTDKTKCEDVDMSPKSKDQNKTEITDNKRLSFAPQRQSIIFSREDLLNNISMAQAALQKSRIEIDESDMSIEESKDISANCDLKRSRLSTEVVKTLNFDESVSDMSMKSNLKHSPLKKTVFGETSYMNDGKGRVIPTYLKDVSDGIKELMLDLVKPVAEVLPFDASALGKPIKSPSSGSSKQIQANLMGSSQIDLAPDLYSNPSIQELDRNVGTSQTDVILKPTLKSPGKYSVTKETAVDKVTFAAGCSESPKVIVFDHNNPLNNILLGPIQYSNSHKYEPIKLDTSNNTSETNTIQDIDSKADSQDNSEQVSRQYFVNTHIVDGMQGDICRNIPTDAQSLLGVINKVSSIDQSIHVNIRDVKDNEVNTVIAMKGNKELLDASSSLTLVDESAIQDGDLAREVSYIINDEEQKDDDSGELSNEESQGLSKCKKRIYSPANKNQSEIHSVDATPKPSSKVQKMSNSPNVYRTVLDVHLSPELHKRTHTKNNVVSKHEKVKEKKKSPSKLRDRKPNQNLTIEQLVTEYSIEANINNDFGSKMLKSLIPTSETAPTSIPDSSSLDAVSSFTSSNNLKCLTRSPCSTETQSTGNSVTSQMDWRAELSSGSSRTVNECESIGNVVAKIDMLHFMGSHECEWEASSTDRWYFRLLHGRIRLLIRLAHRLDNATRTTVRGDTPVLDTSVDTVEIDKNNAVAALCIQFACETMHYLISKASPTYARDIPPLLRRCAAVARVALKWGRAMHNAKLHLAYTLDSDGYLTLKVANIPLRSVWEVSMHIKLVVEESRELPWPRACDVRVSCVVSDVAVAERDVARALSNTPLDWGHAPRALWRMFRYLKHKTRDDDILLGA